MMLLQVLLTALLSISVAFSKPLLKRASGYRPVFTDKNAITEAYKTAQRRVIMSDYDGTLVPFVNDPEDAVPSEQLLSDLHVLTMSTRNSVWLISGRDQKFLSKHFSGIPGLGLSAEHGAVVKNPREDWKTLAKEDEIAKWKEGAQKIMEKWAASTPGTRVDQKKYSLSWHYREAEIPDEATKAAQKLADELKAALEKNKWDMVVVMGAMVVEVKSRFLDKGEIVRTILQESGSQVDFVFNVGDDTADEKMFAAVAAIRDFDGDYTMWVQNKQNKKTNAKWRIPGPSNEENAWNSPSGLLEIFALLTKGSKTKETN